MQINTKAGQADVRCKSGKGILKKKKLICCTGPLAQRKLHKALQSAMLVCQLRETRSHLASLVAAGWPHHRPKQTRLRPEHLFEGGKKQKWQWPFFVQHLCLTSTSSQIYLAFWMQLCEQKAADRHYWLKSELGPHYVGKLQIGTDRLQHEYKFCQAACLSHQVFRSLIRLL